MKLAGLALTSALAVCLVACTHPPPAPPCVPGETSTCNCLAELRGVQSCNPSGSGWSECRCLPRDCEPPTTRSCECGDSRPSGYQVRDRYTGDFGDCICSSCSALASAERAAAEKEPESGRLLFDASRAAVRPLLLRQVALGHAGALDACLRAGEMVLEVADSASDRRRALEMQAECLIRQGNPARALGILKDLPGGPSTQPQKCRLAWFFGRLGHRLPQALAWAREADVADPNRCRRGLATVLAATGEREEAAELMAEYLASDAVSGRDRFQVAEDRALATKLGLTPAGENVAATAGPRP